MSNGKNDIVKIVDILGKAAAAYLLYDAFTEAYNRRKKERLKEIIKSKVDK